MNNYKNKFQAVLLLISVISLSSARNNCQALKENKRYKIEIAGLLGNRLYTGMSAGIDKIARSKYGYGYSLAVMYSLETKPPIEIGMEFSGFFDYVRWRRDWIPSENTFKHDMAGNRDKSGLEIKTAANLFLFSSEKIVNPYAGAAFGIFEGRLERTFSMNNVGLYSEPEFRPIMPLTENKLEYSYTGYILEMKAGLSKELKIVQAGLFLEIRRVYYIKSTPEIYGLNGDDNLNYYSATFGILFRF